MKKSPLADLLRPVRLDDVVGQPQLLDEKSVLKLSIQKQRPLSILLWGPPGSGKTTIARLYGNAFTGSRFIPLSAVFSGVADLRKIFKEVEDSPLFNRQTILFVDEIHRFNKAQQDAFLHSIEDGSIILIGATTENPSFSLNNALLSRLRVLKLNALDEAALEQILRRFEEQAEALKITPEARSLLIHLAGGDARHLLNMVENIIALSPATLLAPKDLSTLLQKRAALFDKGGEGHYNLISALHKSVRGSDPQASLYWFARMLEGGEDPLFIARRLIRMASEDVGLADPAALAQTIAAKDAYEMLGSPEGELALAQAVVYLALAPKSNAIYTAYGASRAAAHETNQQDPPMIILNAPTRLMKELGYGKGYVYDHDTPEGFSGQNYFPDGLFPQPFYNPVERGFEREMKKRIDYFNQLKKKKDS